MQAKGKSGDVLELYWVLPPGVWKRKLLRHFKGLLSWLPTNSRQSSWNVKIDLCLGSCVGDYLP